ncbi:MAG: CbrC family protein [Coprobacillaceae bacterium]
MTYQVDKDGFPIFPYHPNAKDIAFEKTNETVTCDCCHKETTYHYQGMYAVEDIDYLCPECIVTGKAADTFDGDFIQDVEFGHSIDVNKTKEFLRTTPGYVSWQGEHWLTHCNDFCEYLGSVGVKELEELGILDEVCNDYEALGGYEDTRKYLEKDGSFCGYLFRCKHCGKYRIHVDAD